MSEPRNQMLCPYCGHLQKTAFRCSACGGLMDDQSKMATQIAMGPWFIRDSRKPYQPGCSYEVLSKLIRSGRVDKHSIIRGPSTHQFWESARRVPGVAHLLGYCHSCRTKVNPADAKCRVCGAAFERPEERNTLGLQYRTPEQVGAAQEALDRFRASQATVASPQPRPIPATVSSTPAPSGAGVSKPAKQGDLLDEVLGAAPAGPIYGSTPVRAEAPPPLPPNQPAGESALDELAAVTADLPAPGRGGTSRWLIALLVVLIVVMAVLQIIFIMKSGSGQ